MTSFASALGMAADVFVILLLILGGSTLTAIVTVSVMLIISSRRRERLRAKWLEYETLKAARKLHYLTANAFQDLLDEARREGRQ